MPLNEEVYPACGLGMYTSTKLTANAFSLGKRAVCPSREGYMRKIVSRIDIVNRWTLATYWYSQCSPVSRAVSRDFLELRLRLFAWRIFASGKSGVRNCEAEY
jgi:hypothetical protein